ncbi:MAG: septation protein SpoVG family protein [bacterium]
MCRSKNSSFLLVTICLFALFVLTGCGGSDDDIKMESVDSGSNQNSSSQNQAMQPSNQQQSRSRQNNRQTQQQNYNQQQSSNQSQSSSSVSSGNVLKNYNLAVTEVKSPPSGSNVTIKLNDQITIKSLKLPKTSSFVKWPKDDEGNNYIWFDEMKVKNAIDRHIKNKKTSKSSSKIKITKVKFNAYKNKSLRGFMDVTINKAFTINGIKLMKTDKEYWLGMPSKKGPGGQYYDLVKLSDSLYEKVKKRGVKKLKNS